MKSFKKLLCAGLTLAVMSSAMAFAGCTGKTAEEPQKELTYQEATYQKYRAYAEAMGDEVLTYEEWLESIRGEDGKDGASWHVGMEEPAATVGKNGDFYLNTSNFDLYLKSNNAWSRIGNIKGEKGDKGETGAKGDKGETGAKGDPGEAGSNWYTGTEESPMDNENASKAKDGDIYFNTEKLEIWQKQGGSWVSLGSFGASQETGEKVVISAGQTATVPLDGVEQGWNYVYADLGDATLDKDTNLQAYIDDGTHSTFIKSAEQSAGGKNVYFGVVNVTEGASELTLAAAEQSVSAAISFKSCSEVKICDNVPVEMAIFGDADDVNNSLKIEIDSTLFDKIKNVGNYNVNVKIEDNEYIKNNEFFLVSVNPSGRFSISLAQDFDNLYTGISTTVQVKSPLGDQNYMWIQTMTLDMSNDGMIHPCIFTFDLVEE